MSANLRGPRQTPALVMSNGGPECDPVLAVQRSGLPRANATGTSIERFKFRGAYVTSITNGKKIILINSPTKVSKNVLFLTSTCFAFPSLKT